MIGIYLVHGWMHFFMVRVDYRLFGTCWCMVDALFYVDRLISVEDRSLILVGVEYVSLVLHNRDGSLVELYSIHLLLINPRIVVHNKKKNCTYILCSLCSLW